MRVLTTSIAGLAALLGLPAAASAATCHVTPQAVSFGNYDPIGGPSVDGIGSVNVTCDVSTDFAVAMTAGSGSFADRRMSSGAAQLSYNLYTNTSRSIVWADGIVGSSVSSSGTNVDLTIYGRIVAGQNVPSGAYVDAITVSITY